MKRKIDTKINGEVLSELDGLKKRDKKRVPIRIDKATIILVEKKKANKKYIAEYSERLEKSRDNFR